MPYLTFKATVGKKGLGECCAAGLMEKYFPHHNLRPYQREVIEFAHHVFSDGEIVLLNSPCGTGKSVSVLTGYLMARENHETAPLFVLIRVTNQLEIYCRELRQINAHSGLRTTAVVLRNKMDMCPVIQDDESIRRLSYHDFLAYCQGSKEVEAARPCSYYQRTYRIGRPTTETIAAVQNMRETGPLLPEEAYVLCRERGVCPYEATKLLARNADVVVGNYNHILVEPIRQAILSRSGLGLEEINCVVDEAHGLPEYASAVQSDELTLNSVVRAGDEVEDYNIEEKGLIRGLEKALRDMGREAFDRAGRDNEHLVPKHRLLQELESEIGISSEDELSELLAGLESYAADVRSTRLLEGKPPFSYFGRAADFLRKWLDSDPPLFVHYAKASVAASGRAYEALGVRCLDPSVAAAILNQLHSTILMSGTLWNLQYYADILGLDESRMQRLSLPTPFSSDSRLLLVDREVTTKYESRSPLEWRRIASHLQALLDKVQGRSIVYFPSYEIMWKIVELVSIGLPYLMEARRTRLGDVQGFLRSNDKCVVYAVARGKISEGVDLTHEETSLLSAVFIVGLPYPKRTLLQDAFRSYLREKLGSKAGEHVNDVPCANTLAQCVGRLIRSERDRGIIAILDKRTTGSFSRRLPDEWRRDMVPCDSLDKLEGAVEAFLSRERLDK